MGEQPDPDSGSEHMLYYDYNCHYIVAYEDPAMMKAVMYQILSAFVLFDIIISTLKTSKDNEIQCHILEKGVIA